MGNLDVLYVVPTARHPWKLKTIAPLAHRTVMLMALFRGRPFIVDGAVEAFIGRQKKPNEPVYTIEVLERCMERDSGSWRLVVGSDEYCELHRWHRSEELVQKAPPLVVPRLHTLVSNRMKRARQSCKRGEFHVGDVSSTAVRKLLAAGDLEGASHLVPPAVLQYIKKRRLYLPT